MSVPATTRFDLKTHLASRVRQAAETYLLDLRHVPADRLASAPMGKARSPLDFTAEVAGFNVVMAGIIARDPQAWPPDDARAAYVAQFTDHDSCERYLRESIEVLISKLEAMDEDQLHGEVVTYWGAAKPAYQLVEMAAQHMTYHDGQLNYIQALYGDAANHWMD